MCMSMFLYDFYVGRRISKGWHRNYVYWPKDVDILAMSMSMCFMLMHIIFTSADRSQEADIETIYIDINTQTSSLCLWIYHINMLYVNAYYRYVRRQISRGWHQIHMYWHKHADIIAMSTSMFFMLLLRQYTDCKRPTSKPHTLTKRRIHHVNVYFNVLSAKIYDFYVFLFASLSSVTSSAKRAARADDGVCGVWKIESVCISEV